jgi:transposase
MFFSQIAAVRDVGSHQKMIVHADNAGPHVAEYVTEYMDDNLSKRAPRPPYSPDLSV